MTGRTRVSREFGEAVRAVIGSQSQSEAALQSQISVGYLNRMVRGSVPSREIILQFAAALHSDAAPLLQAAGYSSEPHSDHTLPLLREEAGGTIHAAQAPGESRPSPVRRAPVPANDGDILGPMATAQYFRELWDRYVKPAFPEAEMPSGAGRPRTRPGLRSYIAQILADLIDEEEEMRGE